MSTRVGVNVFAIQKLAKLEICRFFCCCCFFFYELKRENEFENEGFSVHFSNRVNEGGKLTPTLNEHLLYTQVLTLQLL